MNRTAIEKYKAIEDISPTACVTLALILPLSAISHMPDISFILSGLAVGVLIFLSWQTSFRGTNPLFTGILAFGALVLFWAKVEPPIIHLPKSLCYLQGIGVPAFSLCSCVWIRKLFSKSSNPS